jgi:hypothetical protein
VTDGVSALTEEEERYAETWKELCLRTILLFGWVGLSFLTLVCSDVAHYLGFTSVAKAGIWLFVLCCFGGAFLGLLFVAAGPVLQCPRCGARHAFDEDGECRRCKLPTYAPRNPDPNWRA